MTIISMKFYILPAVNINIMALLDVTPCSLADGNVSKEPAVFIHPEDADSRFLQTMWHYTSVLPVFLCLPALL
jgi:hypothetical protein